MVKEIQLTQGYVALVDDEDFERVNEYKWYAQRTERKGEKTRAYAARRKNERKFVYLYRYLIDY